MVSVLASSAVYRGFEPWSGPTKTINFVFFASPLSMQHEGERANTDWPLLVLKKNPRWLYFIQIYLIGEKKMWTIDVMSTYTYKIDINHAVKSQDTFIYLGFFSELTMYKTYTFESNSNLGVWGCVDLLQCNYLLISIILLRWGLLCTRPTH
jgi:hypothetical protein